MGLYQCSLVLVASRADRVGACFECRRLVVTIEVAQRECIGIEDPNEIRLSRAKLGRPAVETPGGAGRLRGGATGRL